MHLGLSSSRDVSLPTGLPVLSRARVSSGELPVLLSILGKDKPLAILLEQIYAEATGN